MGMPETHESRPEPTAGPPPSSMLALLPPNTPEPAITDVQAMLSESELDIQGFEVLSPRQHQKAAWGLATPIRFPDREEPMRFEVWLQRMSGGPPPLDVAIGLSDEERAAAADAEWMIHTETQFGHRALWDYHRQLKVLAVAAPEASLVLDVEATAVHSAAWARDAAASRVPPSPLALFRLHAVWPHGGGNRWLHTHGLLRCGTVELEVVDVPADAAAPLDHLVAAVATAFLDLGTPPPGQVFTIGQGLDLFWLPWEAALKHVPEGMWSEGPEREQGHSVPSGILLRPKRALFGKKFGSPADYADVLAGDPVLVVSASETERMAALAKERFERFAAVQRRFGDDTANWAFLVKLGLPTDDAAMADESEPTHEHLWFSIHSIADDQVDATLINEPYGISSLREGDRGIHSLEHMSDWAIINKERRFTPDEIFFLERALESRPA